MVKWCLGAGEPRVENALTLLDAHLDGTIHASVLDLTLYEVGNALVGKGFQGEDLATLLELLDVWDLEWLGLGDAQSTASAAALAERYDLSFYDASYLAVAVASGLPLVTDDALLLAAARDEGLGVALADMRK